MAWTLTGSLKGPPGADGSGASYVHTQDTPAATWTVIHGLGRVPHNVQILIGGEEVFTDTQIDATQVVITFPSPTTGVAHII